MGWRRPQADQRLRCSECRGKKVETRPAWRTVQRPGVGGEASSLVAETRQAVRKLDEILQAVSRSYSDAAAISSIIRWKIPTLLTAAASMPFEAVGFGGAGMKSRRHCEQSEAIQPWGRNPRLARLGAAGSARAAANPAGACKRGRLDCFALLAMTGRAPGDPEVRRARGSASVGVDRQPEQPAHAETFPAIADVASSASRRRCGGPRSRARHSAPGFCRQYPR